MKAKEAMATIMGGAMTRQLHSFAIDIALGSVSLLYRLIASLEWQAMVPHSHELGSRASDVQVNVWQMMVD